MILRNPKAIGLMIFLVLLSCAMFLFPTSGETPAKFSSIRIPFTQGQVSETGEVIKYQAKTAGAALHVTPDGDLYYSVYGKEGKGLCIKETFVCPTISAIGGEEQLPSSLGYIERNSLYYVKARYRQ